MRRILSFCLVLVLVLNLTACFNSNGEIETLKEQVAQLTTENESLKAQITQLTTENENLKELEELVLVLAEQIQSSPILDDTSGKKILGKENWYYQTSNGERDEYIEGIFLPLFDEFVNIFGNDIMTHKPVIISNSPIAATPITMPYGDYIEIKLHQSDTSYWAQTIFQLSHEMTHYAFFSLFPDINQENYNEKPHSSWNEEIICEAMSLYMLKYMSENWNNCSLSEINPNFNTAIKEYLMYAYSGTENLPMKSNGEAISLKDFQAMSDKAGDNRHEHATEANYLYDLFLSVNADDIGEILNMYDYFNSEYFYIDYESWANNAKNREFIKNMNAIQPKLK